MGEQLRQLCRNSSFHLNQDLVGLWDMIKAFSLKLSRQARERLAWMDCYRECGNVSLVCRKFGIARKSFYRWRKRYDPWDLTSLESLSRCPKRFPRKTPWDIELKVLAVKREHPRWGKEKLALYLKVKQGIALSGKTIWRILTRHKLVVRYKTRKRKAPRPRVNWAEIHSPGDLAELDTKFISLNGKRVYQYTFIDVASRWRYCEIYPLLDGQTTVRFLSQALNKAPVKFKAIQTDNGHEFQKVVTAWLRENNIRHLYTHKGRPTENSYVERSHRTDEEEFYSLGGYGTTLTELRTNFAGYMAMYNNERPHWGLKGKTPVETLNLFLTTVCQMC
jgi:transposase InsO family protein